MKQIILLAMIHVALAASSNNSALRKFIFQDYDKLVRPDHQVELIYGQTILSVDLDVEKEELSVSGWNRMEWTDMRLAYKEHMFPDIKSLHVPISEVWLPDIFVYNAVDELKYLMPTSLMKAIIEPNGHVIFIPPVSFKTGCEISRKKPRQTCDVKIGSWTENQDMLDIILKDREHGADVDLSYLLDNSKVEVLNSNMTVEKTVYDCCPETYVAVFITLDLELKPDAGVQQKITSSQVVN